MDDLISSKLADPRLSRVAGSLSAMLQPAIRLQTFSCNEDELPLGSSRIGGRPDLPDDVMWPIWKDEPLAFLAQINLSDLSKFSFASVLPREGWLYFFYDANQSTWGFDPNDKGSWAVVFIPNSKTQIRRREVPSGIPQNGFYKSCGVKSRAIITPQPWESPAVEKLKLSRTEQDVYMEFLDELRENERVSHQLIGHPQPIQGDMQLECQLVVNGLYCGNSTGYSDPRAKELARGAENWGLLFQLDSDDEAGMMWGDVGRLYFWINQENLLHRRFEESWMVLQCG